MIAPHNGRIPDPEASWHFALRARLRHVRAVRAFEDKEGGWTLVTSQGIAMRVMGSIAVYVWERLQGRGCAVCDLIDELAERFPGVPRERITRDLLEFTGHLLEAGFIAVGSGALRPRVDQIMPPKRFV
jgi:hypothetical protein